MLLSIYRSLLKIKPFIESSTPVTFVSVIVACRNEQSNLPFLLDCIAGQDYPKELFEVIIIDDNSTDATFEIASGYKGEFRTIAIYNKGIGKKEAVRSGVNSASGTLVITTDADCRMGTKWIRTISAFYDKLSPDMIVCPVQIESTQGFFGKFQELEFLSLQGITAGSAAKGDGTMCNGANLAFTAEAYHNNEDNLHFGLASGDDVFLLHSLKKKSHSRILWLESKNVLITTSSSSTISSYLKQRSRWLAKGKAYKDRYTILQGIVTFVTILLQLSLLIAGFFNPSFILVFLTVFTLKSIPDFLLLRNTSVRYDNRKIMRLFLPAQFIYPFYVFAVFLFSLRPDKKKNF
jgi:cellulose synthase/poly-beta-1,6-N-acetylglucosamine synthase-like glycosyltransferase